MRYSIRRKQNGRIRQAWMVKIFALLILGQGFTAPGMSQDTPDERRLANAGEKLFMRQANPQGKTCADCHYSTEPDSLNWNPSAQDLAGRSTLYSEEGIGKYFESPEGEVMKAAHDGVSLSGEEENQVVAYLADLDTRPATIGKSFKWRLWLFLGMFGLLILFRIERKRFRKVPRTVRRMLVPMAWAVIFVIMFQDAVGFNRSQHYAPVQPIKFSHSIHYTGNQIDCNFCHSGVLKGKNAGIPPVSLCMNCHKHVEQGTRTGFFEIRKIRQAAEDSIPIRWVRIHNLPDFAYFNHMQHVTVGGVECVTCHGEVENMHIVEQTEDLSMGWCIDCHDKTAVDFSNEYYKTYYPAFVDSIQTGKIDSVMVSDIGGRECGKCHY
jgi:mono/diheme cytochrome c family protein